MARFASSDDDHGVHAPRRLFASLGFGFVHRFLWLVLAGCGGLTTAGVALAWHFESHVTVQATGVVRPRSGQIVKSRLDGIVDEVLVRDGDRVRAKQILFVLSPEQLRGRLAQVEQDLGLSVSRQAVLATQIEQQRRELEALLRLRRLEVDNAEIWLDRVRREQRLSSDAAPPGWKRRPLEQLIPVREAAARVDLAVAQEDVARRQLEANAARSAELAAERRLWARADRERLALWRQLEQTVVRAPSAGVVLTRDLELRRGDHVRAGEGLVELAAPGAWRARVHVRQVDRPKVVAGQRAQVFVEAFPHLRYGSLRGRVTRVAAQTRPQEATYPVEIALDRTALALADGMAAEARVEVDRGRILQLVWRRLLRELGGLSRGHLQGESG